MDEIIRLAADLQAFLEERGWSFAIIGGVANLAWGEVRTTRDVDVTLYTAFKDEESFVSEILKRYKPRIADAKRFAMQARVLLLVSDEGYGIDIGLGGFPFEERALGRSVKADFGKGFFLRVVIAEDLIAMKCFAGRDQDWADVTGIVRRQGDKLDWKDILASVADLAALKDDEEMLPKLVGIRERFGA